MIVTDLLAALLRVAMKSRDVAQIIRSEPALLELLVQEKKGKEKNERFVQDFKTLSDVLIQEMVSHDLAEEFPEMEGSIFGEESKQFTNALGESKTIHLCPTADKTKQLLMEILDNNEEAALLLSTTVHRQVSTLPNSYKLNQIQVEIADSDVGIWIDPIDSTAQYIRGLMGELDEAGLTNEGLQCVVVLIGAFQKSTGLPIIGVAVQPFWELDPLSQKWKDEVTWGVCYQDVKLSSVDQTQNKGAPEKPVIIMSTSESEKVKQMLSSDFHVCFTSGAGYKLLCTAQCRVDAYVLSKNTIFSWDCCAPHAILKAIGGGVVSYKNTLDYLRSSGKSTPLLEDLKQFEVNYNILGAGRSGIDGIIGYRCPDVLIKVVQALLK